MEASIDNSTPTNVVEDDCKPKEDTVEEEAMEGAMEEVSEVPKARGKRSKTGPKKPKTPIVKRPFKKIDKEVLQSRIADMSKKLDFMTEKMTQLRKRFELHKEEEKFRQTETNSSS